MRGLAWVLVTVMGISLGLRAQADLPFADAAPAPKRGGVLRVVDEAPGSPFGIPWEIVGVSVCAAVPALEPLLWMDRAGRVMPKLAERWEISPDRRTITLSLRRGVKFHDGTDLTAQAVQFNLQKQMERGIIPYFEAVEAVDRNTVRIRLKGWDNRVLVTLAGTPATVISPAALERLGVERARWHPVGTGPFQLERYERDAYVRYRRFGSYWDRGKPYLDGVEIRFIRDPQTLKAALLAGQIDVAGLQDLALISELRAAGFELMAADNAILTLIPDSANADSPFADRRVREALSYAIDREAIVRGLGFGLLQPTTQLAFPEQSAYLRDYRGPTYNPARARELLAQAGYPNGFSTRLIPAPFIPRDHVVAIQRYLREVGIHAELEFPEAPRYREYSTRGWRGILVHFLGFFANYNSFVGFYFVNPPEVWASMARPAALNQVFAESVSTLRPEGYKTQQLHRILLQEHVHVTVWRSPRAYAKRPQVQGTNHMKWVTWPWWTPGEAWIRR